MKGYKAFSKGLICRDKSYKENTIFEEENAEICKSGMHFCKNPLDTLDYYPLIDDNGNITEFAEVEALDDVKTDDNKKFCTKKLKVGAKLTLSQFIKASIDVTYENSKTEVEKETKMIKSNGYNATLAGGENAKLAGGNNAKLAGGNNAILAGGNWATLAGGYNATLAGGYNAILAGGENAKLAGGENAILAGGENSLMIGDNGSIAKGKKGAVILLVERDADYNILNFKAVQVDGEKIKEDVLYKLENGEFVEVN
jgi:hypothetical protein